MRTIAMLLLAIAACSAEILRYDTDTPILPYGVSHDWRGVYFDLDDWDTMSYPHATGTFRVDSIEVWYNRWTSPPECKYVIALFSDDCGGLGSPPPIDYDDEVGEDDDKRYVYGFNGEVGLGSYDTPYEAMVAAESALKRMAKAISAEFKKVRL